jgi:prevent-host-death family protein
MPDHDPETGTISVDEAKSSLSDLVNQVSRGEYRVLVDESGIAVAAIVSVDDLEWLRHLEQRREAFFERIDRMHEAFKDVPPEEIDREVDRIIARNRAADRRAKNELAATR